MECKGCGRRHYDGDDDIWCRDQLIEERDEARKAARRIMARFAPRYEVDTWGEVYPWLNEDASFSAPGSSD